MKQVKEIHCLPLELPDELATDLYRKFLFVSLVTKEDNATIEENLIKEISS